MQSHQRRLAGAVGPTRPTRSPSPTTMAASIRSKVPISRTTPSNRHQAHPTLWARPAAGAPRADAPPAVGAVPALAAARRGGGRCLRARRPAHGRGRPRRPSSQRTVAIKLHPPAAPPAGRRPPWRRGHRRQHAAAGALRGGEPLAERAEAVCWIGPVAARARQPRALVDVVDAPAPHRRARCSRRWSCRRSTASPRISSTFRIERALVRRAQPGGGRSGCSRDSTAPRRHRCSRCPRRMTGPRGAA